MIKELKQFYLKCDTCGEVYEGPLTFYELSQSGNIYTQHFCNEYCKHKFTCKNGCAFCNKVQSEPESESEPKVEVAKEPIKIITNSDKSEKEGGETKDV